MANRKDYPFALVTSMLIVSLAIVNPLKADEPTTTVDAERLFAVEVLPMLKAKCLACHGNSPEELKGGLDLSSLEGMLAGGDLHGPVIEPGDAEGSPLYWAVSRTEPGLEMPPKENDKLSPEQVDRIHRWIDAGAPWPDLEAIDRYRDEAWSNGSTSGGVSVPTSGGLSDEWTRRRYRPEDLWAFMPLRDVDQPKGLGDAVQDVNPIDAFINDRLLDEGLKPAPRADRRTLIRRATYDLTGLPPTLEEIDAFLNDDQPGVWNRLIERLLSSSHYGEQWGRHWLDVVRYADTSGYSNDWERSNSWRYRDYVIRSFNEDKPYDQFAIEQLAGDELDPDDPEMRVATGFLRSGPWEHTPMTAENVSRQLYLDDLVNNVGQAFLATPLRCAKCHDHKFDPIPTRDYYRVMAAFATTQPAERNTPFLAEENRTRFEEGRAIIEQRLAWAQADVARIKAKEEEAGRAWARERGIPYVPRVSKNNDVPEELKPPRHVGLSYEDQGFLKIREQDVRIWSRRLERFEPMTQTIYNGPTVVRNSIKLRAPQNRDKSGDLSSLEETSILIGGSVSSPGEPVTPGVLSALPVRSVVDNDDLGSEPSMTRIPETISGRRLALARWITDPENPLTTRSIVNRIWQYHFGRGIAANANNFGATGAKPTHPELLEWLTTEFIRRGWSFKNMHRLIMTSEAYQRASAHPERELLERLDPNNHLRAVFRPRRLTAEEIRDSMLLVSGELNREVGGLPVKPEINLEVALNPRMLQFSLAPAYQPSPTISERNRRSIYVFRSRGLADPLFEVFNQPNPDESCELRDASSITPQVFALFHSEASTTRSIAMALRLNAESPSLADRVSRAVQLAFGRQPTLEERSMLHEHVVQMVAYHQDHTPEPIEPPTEVERSLVEEMSGLAFNYVERLDTFEDYEHHTQPWEVDAETRALADLCLLLFNTSEFLYVY